MTEEDYKNKKCPFMSEGYFRNGMFEHHAKVPCMGSECVLWEWDSVPEFEEQNIQGHCGAIE